jgi:hypothetical protein
VPEQASDFITARQVIVELLAWPALRRVAATCVLPAVKQGNEWRYRRTDLDAWLAKQGVARASKASCSPS